MAHGTLADVQPWQDPTSELMRGRYFGQYMGFVKDRNDPEKRGRVRVSVPSLIPGNVNRSKGWLDWCIPATKGLDVPPLGAPVWIQFEQGQIQYGVYTWGWMRGSDAASSDAPNIGKEVTDSSVKDGVRNQAAGQGYDFGATITADTALADKPVYPYNKAFESEGGQLHEFDDTPGKVRFRYRHPTGTSVLVDPDGSVHVRAKGAIYYECEGDFVVNLREETTFKVIYPNGTSLAVGASGLIVTGHQANIIGRTIRKNGDVI